MNEEPVSPLRFLVSGPVACFKRPEFVADFVSYDVITPLAARRMIRSAYNADAAIRIEHIEVLHPMEFEQRTIDEGLLMGLRDVAYILSVALNADTAPVGEDVDRFYPFEPRLTYLGLRELPGEIRRLRREESFVSQLADQPPLDLGWMIYDVIGRGRARARFFRPTMVGGVIDVRREREGMLLG